MISLFTHEEIMKLGNVGTDLQTHVFLAPELIILDIVYCLDTLTCFFIIVEEEWMRDKDTS